jgi:hypothetical protein
MGRAQRRRDLARMVEKARRIYPDHSCPKQMANNLKDCSCFLCGNPRKYGEEPTLACLIADLNWHDWLKGAWE